MIQYLWASAIVFIMKETGHNYHQVVSDYYDKDADMGFEKRAEANASLERIRNDFRTITIKYPFKKLLEIGCGPGFDTAWFAANYPESEVIGVDISQHMVDLANARIRQQKLTNAQALRSDERELSTHFRTGEFDMIIVYFGALNTVKDLGLAAQQIHGLLKPGGTAVLTFVNKWYMREMLVQAIKAKFSIAFARLRKDWGGYSPDRHLPSRCYSPSEIKSAFKDFGIAHKKGYSIFYPAWYNYKKLAGKDEKGDRLWRMDQKIQNSFLWSKGEYTLYVFKKP